MSETVDPLQLLRESLLNNKPIKLNPPEELHFQDQHIKLPRDTKTAWKRSDGKGYYTLGALWFLASNPSLSMGEYMKQAGSHTVVFQDRNEVKQYFSGQIQETNSIDPGYLAQTLIKKSHLKGGKQVQQGVG